MCIQARNAIAALDTGEGCRVPRDADSSGLLHSGKQEKFEGQQD